jgi:hypothetical protein
MRCAVETKVGVDASHLRRDIRQWPGDGGDMLQTIWLEMGAASTGCGMLQTRATTAGLVGGGGGVHGQWSFSLGRIRGRHGLFYDPALDLNRGGREQGVAAARSGGGGRWRHGGEGEGEGRRGGITRDGVDAAGDGAVRAVYCSVGGVGRRRCRRRSGKNGNRKVTDRAAVVLVVKDVPLFSPLRSS